MDCGLAQTAFTIERPGLDFAMGMMQMRNFQCDKGWLFPWDIRGILEAVTDRVYGDSHITQKCKHEVDMSKSACDFKDFLFYLPDHG